MKNHIFKYSLVALATLGICVPNLALAEVSGLGSEEVDTGNILLGDVKFLVGSNGANNNNVVVKNENSLTNYIGGYDATQSAEQNSISINNSKVRIVMGGYSHSKNTNNNSILLEDITLEDDVLVIGGNADNGVKSSADNNIVTIKNLQIQGDFGTQIVGGQGSESANNNEIIVENSTLSNPRREQITGGLALGMDPTDLVNANGNKVTLTNTTYNGDIEAGSARYGNASKNEIVLNGNSKANNVYGASVNVGEANSNTITINGGTYGNVYGGFGNTLGGYVAPAKAITNNTINFNEGKISGDLMGAGGEFDTQSGNTLNIDASKGLRIAGNVGNFDNINFANFGNAKDRANAALKVTTIDLSGTKIDYGDISSLESASYYLLSSTDEIVGLDEGWIEQTGENKKITVTENSYSVSKPSHELSSDKKNLIVNVNVSEQSYGDVLGDSDIEKEALAKAEVITLKEGVDMGANSIALGAKDDFTLNANGVKNLGDVEVGKNTNLNFTNAQNVASIKIGEGANIEIANSKGIVEISAQNANSVTLSNTEFGALNAINAKAVKIANSAFVGDISADNTAKIEIENSTLSDANEITLGENSILIIKDSQNLGSISNANSELIVDNSTFSEANDGSVRVKNFTLRNNTKTINLDSMEVENLNIELPNSTKNGDTIIKITGDKDTELANTSVSVKMQKPNLGSGDKVRLITASNAKLLNAPKSASVDMGLLNANGKIVKSDEQNLDLEIDKESVSADEDSKILLETALSRTVVVNEARNLLAENVDKIASNLAGKAGAFVNLGGFDKKYKTGSHIDQKGFNANFGLAGSVQNGAGELSYGVFGESGKGSYKSRLDNGTTGKGDTKFIGGGAFVKQSFDEGVYIEASASGGSVKTDYKGFVGSEYYEFDLSGAYFGAHAGIGAKIALGEANELDIYGKYFYSHVSGDSADLGGVTLNTKGTDSHRAKFGMRDSLKFNENSAFYLGVAYQYEFSGKANGDLIMGNLGDEIASPKLKGSTGIGEIGYTYENGNVKFDIGAKGYVGKEQGYSGNLGATFKF
ncbi:MAG: autotransporter outer membrane beta-barrel domain-containing protein [Campylobacter sp.]|nr:autotransporter outer membrane beta-barrel domain-containing protein [Campylobacter sp.]